MNQEGVRKNMIRENIEHVENTIDEACRQSGRNRSEVTLIAVSKTKPVEMLKEAYETGCRDFGENKVQELVDKYEVLPKDIRWHMIGHLQRNKVKYIVDKVYLIHSVDSLRLAEEISKEAAKKNVDVNILVEVNVAGEETKFGTGCEEAKQLVRDIAQLPHVHIQGLMTIAPYVENSEENRIYFQQLKKLSVDISSENIDNVSMKVLFFDLETTGTLVNRHGIHQISGMVVIDGEVRESFNFHVQPNPKADITQEALDVAGVTKEQIMAYPPMGEVYRQFVDMLAKYVDKYNRQDKFFLAGYNNASFDNQFLRAWFVQNEDKYFGSWFWSNSIDVMVLATPYLAARRAEMENFKQGTVAKFLGIDVDSNRLHDALYDIEICKAIFDIVSPYKV